MDNSSQSGDSVREEEEDQFQHSQLEESFQNLCIEEKQVESSDIKYLMQLPKPIEMMFILFSFYLDDLVSIGIEENCKVKLSLSKIKILSQVSQQKIEKCRATIDKYLSKLSYTILNHENKFKMLYSPYIRQKAEEKGFRFCKFNDLVYCHSNRMQEKDLITTMKNLFMGKCIFTVHIKSNFSKDRDIYNFLRDFIKEYKKFGYKNFQEREIVVEIDSNGTKINCIGDCQRNLVAVKNEFKNLLESITILIIRFENQEEIDKKIQELKSFVKKKCEFPVLADKIEKRALTLISKENVIRKILENKKVLQILKINNRTELGMFLPRRYNITQKRKLIEEICTQKGYDFTTLGGIYHYFKKMFIHEGEEVDPKEIISLIIEILVSMKENKEKFDVPELYKNTRREHIDFEITEGEYYSTGEIEQDLAITKILKRNVLRQKLRSSKPAFVRYRACQADESPMIYWYLKDNKQKIQTTVQQMKYGTDYFSGKMKKLGEQKHYLYESKILIT